jgi:hypothetical protein
MTRLAATHPKWASRDDRLGNDQASAASEVHADDTKMMAHGGTGQKARTAADPPGPQRWPSNCGGSRNQRHTSMPYWPRTESASPYWQGQ